MFHTHDVAERCEACGTRTTNLRRNRCTICYLRWADTRPVGKGAACVICCERRHEHLRAVEFQGHWLNMCHNCAARAFRLEPLPPTLTELRWHLARHRRWRERRGLGVDTRM